VVDERDAAFWVPRGSESRCTFLRKKTGGSPAHATGAASAERDLVF